MDDPEKKEQTITMSELSPKRLLKGAVPRLIDEWQLAPKLWDAIRFEVDHRGELGQFVLTGSAVPPDTKEITHSGTGYFTWLTMRPMSLFESGESTGDVSLKALFAGNAEIDGESQLDIERLAFLVCRGGWPQAVDLRDEIALDQALDYYDAVVHSDINRADHVQKNPERVKRLMRSYARNQGAQTPNTVLVQDISVNDEGDTHDATAHAEFVLASRASRTYSKEKLWKCTLYTTCEPCPMCTGGIYWANIGRIVYGISEARLLELTGADDKNPTFSMGADKVIAAGQKAIGLEGPVL